MKESSILMDEIKRGIEGKNESLPMGFNRIDRHIGIRRRIYTLVFGAPGSGKSSFVHSAYILNPIDWYIKNRSNIKFKIILFSMERSKVYTYAKWLCRKIFLEEGVVIPLYKMLGWWNKVTLDREERELVEKYIWYIDEVSKIVSIVEGPKNPTGIYRYVKDYAAENGHFDHIDEYTIKYYPNDPEERVIIIEDHIGLTKVESGCKTKKEAIDKLSEYNQYFRDVLGYTPVAVSQLNRNLSNPLYLKLDSFEPTIDDIKESGRPGEDADVVISLFDPVRYRTQDSSYKVDNFIDPNTGAKHFRSIKILKNTYGEDDVKIGMAFMGSTGMFKELPKSKDMGEFDYDSLFNGTYYLS